MSESEQSDSIRLEMMLRRSRNQHLDELAASQGVARYSAPPVERDAQGGIDADPEAALRLENGLRDGGAECVGLAAPDDGEEALLGESEPPAKETTDACDGAPDEGSCGLKALSLGDPEGIAEESQALLEKSDREPAMEQSPGFELKEAESKTRKKESLKEADHDYAEQETLRSHVSSMDFAKAPPEPLGDASLGEADRGGDRREEVERERLAPDERILSDSADIEGTVERSDLDGSALPSDADSLQVARTSGGLADEPEQNAAAEPIETADTSPIVGKAEDLEDSELESGEAPAGDTGQADISLLEEQPRAFDACPQDCSELPQNKQETSEAGEPLASELARVAGEQAEGLEGETETGEESSLLDEEPDYVSEAELVLAAEELVERIGPVIDIKSLPKTPPKRVLAKVAMEAEAQKPAVSAGAEGGAADHAQAATLSPEAALGAQASKPAPLESPVAPKKRKKKATLLDSYFKGL